MASVARLLVTRRCVLGASIVAVVEVLAVESVLVSAKGPTSGVGSLERRRIVLGALRCRIAALVFAKRAEDDSV